jgi:hypothetical protein
MISFRQWLRQPIEVTLEQVLSEANLKEILSSTEDFDPFTTKRQNAIDPIKITNVDLKPSIGTRTLIVTSLAQNEGHEYKPLIQFKEVKYSTKRLRGYVPIKIGESAYYMKLPVFNANDVTLSCPCGDYRFRFAEVNFTQKCHYGNISRKYENKYVNNPDSKIGACKHLIALVRNMFDQHILV